MREPQSFSFATGSNILNFWEKYKNCFFDSAPESRVKILVVSRAGLHYTTTMKLAELVPGLGYIPLGGAPSPVRKLDLDFAVETWVKDEAAYGSIWGGNKIRKLEWLIPEAKRRGVTTLFTVGGIGTHWGLACALYGREHGLKTVLGLMDQPLDDHVRDQLKRLEASGAVIYRYSNALRLEMGAAFLMLRYRPWFISPGGSTPLGALGFVDAALEIAAQVESGELPAPGTIIVPVGSGGTAAGLALGLKMAGLKTRLLGIVVNDSQPLTGKVLSRLGNESGELLRKHGLSNVPGLSPGDFDLRRDWLGACYGDPTPASVSEVKRAGENGIELEPVYTGKTLAALRDLAPTLPCPVLWINTHGPR